MMPMYRYMDSDSYQRNQTFSFPQPHYPGLRANLPRPFESWPYGGNYSYPISCHSCCTHNNVPGHDGFRPSHPHASMPSPVYFYGGYPLPYHEAYPVPYVPPTPHYSMEIPKYEYDKNMPPSFHCCGCPNHPRHQNIDKGVKIEEQGPVVEKKAHDSLVPVQLKNNPYPIVWIPPESMNGGEQRKLSEPETIDEKKIPCNSKPRESLKSQEGDQRHGWFPFDLNNIGSLMQGENKGQVQDHQKQMEDKNKEFPFPIFWVPSYEEIGKKDKDVNASQDQQSEDQKKQFPFPFFWLPYENKEEEVGKEDKREMISAPKIVPMNIAEKGDVTNETGVNEEKPAGQRVVERKENTANQKSIHVKQMNQEEEENKYEDTERRGRSVPVKHVEDNVANKPSGTSVRGQSSFPKKSSELPPVCLRVDPLPKKKKANGSSRSPSPHGAKGLKQESSTDATKPSASLGLQENAQQDSKSAPKYSKEVEPSKKEKVIPVVDRNSTVDKDAMRTPQIPVSSKERISRKPTIREAGKDETRCEVNEDEGARMARDTTVDNVKEINKPAETVKSVVDGRKLEKKTMSDIEAAVRIQSAYRGFEVRRWEPLKKLKQIAEVREQVGDVRNHIASLETSDLQNYDKQKVVIGETIMRLLLKLDTIQGLLPSFRDIRRSLARELVVLQEKLDDLITKKCQDTPQEASTITRVEELSSNANNNNCMLEQKDEVKGLGEGPADGGSDGSHHATEPCQGQVLYTTDYVPALSTKEPDLSDHGELHKASKDSAQELPVASGLKSEDLGLESVTEQKNDVVNGQNNSGQISMVNTEMGNGSTGLEQCSESPSLVEDKTVCTGISSEVVNTNPQTIELEELPRGATDNGPAISEPEKDEKIEMNKNEVHQSGEVELEMSPDVTSPNAGANVTDKEAEMHEQADLPQSMIDEESPANEFKKIEEVEVVKEDDVLESGEEEHQMVLDATSQHDGTPNLDQLEPQPEGEMEEQPILRSKERVKMDSHKDEELPGDSVLTAEVELPPQEKASKDDFLPLVFESIESQPLSLPVQIETQDAVHEDGPSDVIDGDITCSSALADPGRPIEDEVPIERSTEDSKYQQAATAREDREVDDNKVECEDYNRLASGAETAKEDLFLETQSTPVQKTELASPTKGCAVGVENERSLVEENEKLREMMQKLMEAGNEQLQVISKLTGRVKDLEKKLAKKKKVRTRRYRAASPPGTSCMKPSNDPLKEGAVGVAM
ncbi:hypothetical protein L3X38_013620 [Prunus dulcis]|uniref:BAG domain-containing protein n=1 Tax=Prunus dulcis TaxID=3755 RepID=A0AAD4ZHQ3_PRUDU|nr:hypothetical protein L3X38_013620 [Prunus dulcis]